MIESKANHFGERNLKLIKLEMCRQREKRLVLFCTQCGRCVLNPWRLKGEVTELLLLTATQNLFPVRVKL